MAILVISSFMLMPGQSLTALGLEIAAVGVLLFFVGSGMEIYALRKVNLQNRRPFIGNLVLPEIGISPLSSAAFSCSSALKAASTELPPAS